MNTATEIRTGVSLLVGIQMLLAFGALGVVVRMSPAIERVLVENVTSITAVEGMYAAIAARDCGLDPGQAEMAFDQSLTIARNHITEPSERVLIDSIDESWRLALVGDCDDRMATSDRLDQLADLNRSQMSIADADAKRLGAAGAWATVMLGLATFAASAVMIRRFTQRIASPLSEIEAVLLAAASGDPYRRCRRLDAPAEYGVIAARLNQLLDRRLAREEVEDPQLKILDRMLIHHLMDTRSDVVVAVDTSGAVIAASDGALDVLAASGVDSLADALAVTPDGDADGISMIQNVQAFGNGSGFLISLRPLDALPPSKAGHLGEDVAPAPAPITSRPTLTNPLADKGGADGRPVIPPSPRDKKPDWERD